MSRNDEMTRIIIFWLQSVRITTTDVKVQEFIKRSAKVTKMDKNIQGLPILVIQNAFNNYVGCVVLMSQMSCS